MKPTPHIQNLSQLSSTPHPVCVCVCVWGGDPLTEKSLHIGWGGGLNFVRIKLVADLHH